jgi:hypothetical protein
LTYPKIDTLLPYGNENIRPYPLIKRQQIKDTHNWDILSQIEPLKQAAKTYNSPARFLWMYSFTSKTPGYEFPILKAGETALIKFMIPPGITFANFNVTSNDWNKSAPLFGVFDKKPTDFNAIENTKLSSPVGGYSQVFFGALQGKKSFISNPKARYAYLIIKARKSSFTITTLNLHYSFPIGIGEKHFNNFLLYNK